MGENTVYGYNKKTGGLFSANKGSSSHIDWQKNSDMKVFNTSADRDKWRKEHSK